MKTERLLAVLLALSACAGPKGAMSVGKGAVVKLRYALTVDDRTIENPSKTEPLVYTQGSHQILAGLEEKIAGMKVGEKKSVRLPPSKAYGPLNPAGFVRVARAGFKDPRNLAVGSAISGQLSGRAFRATIAAVEGDAVVLNLNHPLAGKTLRFDVEVADILAR